MPTSTRAVLALLSCSIHASVAHATPESTLGTIEIRIVDSEALQPIEGATVIITQDDRRPVVVSGTTGGDGRFTTNVPPGEYAILALFGDARWLRGSVTVAPRERTRVAGVLAIDVEVTTIREKVDDSEAVPARVVRSTVKARLPYSDEAIDGNYWATGWVLLEVDERGEVTGFRFLHRPGHGLDAIAEKYVFELRFEPARDARGRPIKSRVLWKLEWPAHHYARDHKNLGLGGEGAVTSANQTMAAIDAASDRQSLTLGNIYMLAIGGVSGHAPFMLPGKKHAPPCAGKAPLNLDSHQPIYRDCTPPDLSKLNTERLIERPPPAPK
jgi:hypothetical protein